MPTQLPEVLHEWREPEYDDFRPRNAWSLFNACTEVFKGSSPDLVVARSQALHGLFDERLYHLLARDAGRDIQRNRSIAYSDGARGWGF